MLNLRNKQYNNHFICVTIFLGEFGGYCSDKSHKRHYPQAKELSGMGVSSLAYLTNWTNFIFLAV